MSKKNHGTSRVKKSEENATDLVRQKPVVDLTTLLHPYQELKCKNKTQKDLINLINEKEIVMAAGPAGVGKSYISIARAIELLKNPNNSYKKIIISKPAVEAEEKHGYLPGDMREKMDPFIASTLDIFDKILGKHNRRKMEDLEILEIQPLAYIRGKSIDNSILIMEEAQNMSPNQMKTLLTRIGENSKFIISGDLDQSDRYKNITQSGLYDAIKKHINIPEIGIIEFSNDDIVRNPVISKILANYKRVEYTPRNPIPEGPPMQIIREGQNPDKPNSKRFFGLFG